VVCYPTNPIRPRPAPATTPPSSRARWARQRRDTDGGSTTARIRAHRVALREIEAGAAPSAARSPVAGSGTLAYLARSSAEPSSRTASAASRRMSVG